MRLLLDTSTLIWYAEDSPQLSATARQAVADPSNDILVSAISALEIATKHRVGKLPGAALLAESFEAVVEDAGFMVLPVSAAHARLAGALPGDHGDPFDRVLAAQGLIETLPVLSNDRQLDVFGVSRLW